MDLSKKLIKKYKRPVGMGLLIFFLGGFGGLFVQKYIAPALASKPLFNQLSFLRPDAPIVITKTEQIRVNENVRLADLVKQLTPRVVLIVGGRGSLGQNFDERVRGSGVIVSSDGYIATDSALLADSNNVYFAITTDGQVRPATVLAKDPKSSLALIKIDGNGLAAVDFGQSLELELSQQLVILSGSEAINLSHSRVSYVSVSPGDDNISTVYSSEHYRQTFSLDVVPSAGSGIFNLSGRMMGLGTSSGTIIPAESIRSAVDTYFVNQRIIRPFLGINYSVLTASGSKILGLPVENGIILRSSADEPAVLAGSPAAAAGLRSGDVIFRINGELITPRQPLDLFLNRSKPQDVWRLNIWRDGSEIELEVRLGEIPTL